MRIFILFKVINFLKLIYSIVSQKYYMFKYRKYSSLKNKSSNVFLSQSGVVKLNAHDEQRAKNVYHKAKEFLKKHIKEPDNILRYIENHSTIIVRMKHIEKVCLLLNIAPGFLPKQKGFKTFCLSVMIKLFYDKNAEISSELPDMFLLGVNTPNVYILAHQFYHWMAYKSSLPGYDEQTQRNFRNIWKLQKSEEIKKLSVSEILSLKDAIARDVDALDMVRELSVEFAGQKKCIDKIKTSGSSVV